KILETASRLFFEQGYNNTGINQIIEESKIAKGSLYYNFKSKTDVLINYLNMAEENLFRRFESEISQEKDDMDKLLRLINVRFESLELGGFKGCRFAKIIPEINKEEKSVV